ncbi:MAG: AarF/ABC1/UbiB kinase family protein [Nanoarchaeota archaeon]
MNIFKIKKEVQDIKRFEQILFVLGGEGYHFLIEKFGFAKPKIGEISKDKLSEPVRIRKLLERLGPTFVKLGQLLSLRADLVPHEYCEEFKKLQDNVPSFPYEQVKQIIESELGKPIDKLFKSFDKKPFSAASISQVHKATLHTGENVVVKVQRPNIKSIIESDIDIMEYAASLLEKNEEFKSLKPTIIVREFKEYTEREIDFRFELRNIKKFHEYFSSWKDIGIPQPYLEYSTSKVLVMEFVDGIIFRDILKIKKQGYDLKRLGNLGFKAIFYQIFDLGIVHGDPHPGNLIIAKNKKLYFIDFGIVGFINPDMQENIFKLIISLINRDTVRSIKYFLNISTITPKSNLDAFKKEAETLMTDWHDTTLKEMRFTNLIYEIIRSAGKYEIEVPANLVLIAKALLTIEGTGLEYDPDFNLTNETKPLLNKLIMKKFSPDKIGDKIKKDSMILGDFLYSFPEKTENILEKIEKGEIKVNIQENNLLEIERTMDRNASKRSLSMMAGTFFIGSAIFAQIENQPMLFGYEASTIGFAISSIFLIVLIVMFLKDINIK